MEKKVEEPPPVQSLSLADALAGVAVIAVLRRGEAVRLLADVDGGDEEGVADLDHALGVECRELQRHRRLLLPLRRARQLRDEIVEGRVGSQARSGGQKGGSEQSGREVHLHQVLPGCDDAMPAFFFSLMIDGPERVSPRARRSRYRAGS